MVEMVPVLTGCVMVYFQLEHLMLNQETYLYTFKNRPNMCFKHTLTWTTDKQACALTITQLASTAPLCPCAVLRHCRWFPQWASQLEPWHGHPAPHQQHSISVFGIAVIDRRQGLSKSADDRAQSHLVARLGG